MPGHAKAHLWFPPPCTGPLLPWLAHHYHNGLVITTRHLHSVLVQAASCLIIFFPLQRKCWTPRLFALTAAGYQLVVVNICLWSLICGLINLSLLEEQVYMYTYKSTLFVFVWMCVCIYRTGSGGINIHSGSWPRTWFRDGMSWQGSWGYTGG